MFNRVFLHSGHRHPPPGDERQLTLLQRGVIQRLRKAGYYSIADCAAGCWQSATTCLFAITLRRESAPGITAELAADFERANGQIR